MSCLSILLRNRYEGVVCLVYRLYLGTVMKVWYSCLSLYLGTVMKVWYVLFFIIFRNCSEGVVCLVFHYI